MQRVLMIKGLVYKGTVIDYRKGGGYNTVGGGKGSFTPTETEKGALVEKDCCHAEVFNE